MNLNKEQIEDIFNSTYKKSEICKLLNIDCNGKNANYIDNKILEYSKEIGLCSINDISSSNLHKRYWEYQYKEYEINPKYCVNCGNKIPFEKRLNICCCLSCAASFTNKKRGPKSEEEKNKIRETIQKKIKNNIYKVSNNTIYNGILISELIKQGKIFNENNYIFEDKLLNKNSLKEKTCLVCGKKYYGIIIKSGKISKGNTCSDKCHTELKRIKSKESIKRVIDEGRFIGWKTRNIKSYAETFWHNVLQNNNIEYISEHFLDKKYFLDFYIIKNGIEIDLEIDGKQHKGRKEHDKIRDEYIKSKNIIVYRVEWNEINSEKGSLMMKEKIDNFLEFYNKL